MVRPQPHDPGEPSPARAARAVAVSFLASRAVLWVIAAVAVAAFPQHLNGARAEWDDPLLHDAGDWIDVWARWDSYWYLLIADGGYAWPSSTPAFFPLAPLAIRAISLPLGGHLVVAGVLLSLVAGTAAAVLLYRLGARVVGPDAARIGVVALALFPTSFFLVAVYAEALFLGLAVGALLLAERGRLGRASLLAGLAILTRGQGVALLPALAMLAWPTGGLRAAARAVVPAAAIGAVYPVVLWLWIDRPFAFLDGQEVWERELSPIGPLGGLVNAIADADLFELAFAVVMLALAVAAWRLVGTAYGLYALLVLAIPMSFPSDRLGGLYSFPRLALAAFPCFLAAGVLLASRRRLAALAGVVSATLLVYLLIRWSLWHWVA